MGPKAAQTNYYTEEQAARLGLPLNYSAAINFALTAVNPRDAVGCFSRLRRNRFNKWATRPTKGEGPAFAPTYAYSFENVREGVPFMTMNPGDPHNVHAHWALHLPASRAYDFENHLWEWVAEMTGGITGGAETIMVKPYVRVSYFVKAAKPFVAKKYGRGQPSEPQGIIIGRRADTSRNLGPTARRAYDRELGIKRWLPSRQPLAAHQPAQHA